MAVINIKCYYCEAFRTRCRGKAKGCDLFPRGKPKEENKGSERDW